MCLLNNELQEVFITICPLFGWYINHQKLRGRSFIRFWSPRPKRTRKPQAKEENPPSGTNQRTVIFSLFTKFLLSQLPDALPAIEEPSFLLKCIP